MEIDYIVTDASHNMHREFWPSASNSGSFCNENVSGTVIICNGYLILCSDAHRRSYAVQYFDGIEPLLHLLKASGFKF